MNRFIPTLLRIALSSLPVGVGYPAQALSAVPLRRTLDLRPPDLRSLHVQNLQWVVTSADSAEAEPVTIVAAPLRLAEMPDTHPSLAGVASLYWAARHPTQAWRVFLPIQLDGDDTSADIRATCAGFATAQSCRLACP